MCEDCWKEAGSPQIDNQKVRTAVEALQAADGDLGPLVDDYNVENQHIEADIQTLHGWIDQVWTEGHCLKIIHAMNCFLELSIPERYSALAWVDEFWQPMDADGTFHSC